MPNLSHNLENLLDRCASDASSSRRRRSICCSRRSRCSTASSARRRRGRRRRWRQPRRGSDRAARPRGAAQGDGDRSRRPWGGYELDPSLLSVLTEYEEHRLRENIKGGRALFRIHAAFDLATIDKALDELKGELKPHRRGHHLSAVGGGGQRSADRARRDPRRAGRAAHGAGGGGRDRRGGGAVAARGRRAATARQTSVRATPPSAATSAASAAAAGLAPASARADGGKAAAPRARGAGRRRRGRAVAAVGGADGARRHPQARPPDEHRRRARHRARRAAAAPRRASRPTARRSSSRASCTTSCARFARRLDELQAGILEVRMVPLGQVFDKLSRVVRQISRDAGKEIHLVITGAETEIDKLIVEELSDPLMHMMRNASITASSGPTSARAAGKPAVGHHRAQRLPAGQPRRHRGRGRRRRARRARSWCARRSSAALVGAHEARELSRRDVLQPDLPARPLDQGRRRRDLGARRRHGRRQDEHRAAGGHHRRRAEPGHRHEADASRCRSRWRSSGAHHSRRGAHLRHAAQLGARVAAHHAARTCARSSGAR